MPVTYGDDPDEPQEWPRDRAVPRYEADPADQCSGGGDCQPRDGRCVRCGNTA